jgi:preprotein translocase subunit SecG
LSKSTTVLGTALLVLCVLANFAIDAGGTTQSAVQQSGVEQPAQQNGGLDQSQTPSAVPELPQQQEQGSGSEGDGSGSGSDTDDGGSN